MEILEWLQSKDVLESIPMWLIALSLLVFALRGSIIFDVNRWMEKRRDNRLAEIKSLCPHAQPGKNESGKIAFFSSFISPVGTLAYQCQDCGYVTHDWDFPERSLAYWANNPEIYLKRIKARDKITQKL